MKKLCAIIFFSAVVLLCRCSRAQAVEKQTITINAMGDIMMGTLYPEKHLPPQDGAAIFQSVEQYITNGEPDIVLGNLEGAVTLYDKSTKNVSSGRSFAFRMPPDYIKYLKKAGFTIVTTANNHAMDFGSKGYSDTRSYLQAAGIKAIGNKGEVVVQIINGKKVAMVGFGWNNQFNNILNLKESQIFLQNVKASNDILIVTFHGGSEGNKAIHVENKMEDLYGNPRGNLVKFTHMAIDAGADLVIGHGPHLTRAMELYKGRLIAYSLGNFATYHMFNTSGVRKYTLVLSVELNLDGTLKQAKILPLIQTAEGSYRGIPQYDPQKNTIHYMRKMTQEDFPHTALSINAEGIVLPVAK